MKIEEVDKNLKVELNINKEGIKFYDALENPFKIYGIYMEDGKFRRMPEKEAEKVSEGVLRLHSHCAGGRVRFRTDSQRIAIFARMGSIAKMSHFALTASVGFDLYINSDEGEIYSRTFVPPFNIEDSYESVVSFDDESMRDVTINFPLYSEVMELYIGIDDKSKIEAPTPYIDVKPIVYYGSSITQGGCASRPGNCYQAYISRRFNCDYVNLGFSGNAKAEREMVDYIKKLDMSIFVYDYDHNVPNSQYLRQTHESMFMEIRKYHPNLPIVIMSAPVWNAKGVWRERRDIIEQTYNNARAAGDKNVYFLDGDDLMALCKTNGTVDLWHPNDFGFASMASAVGDVIEKIWK